MSASKRANSISPTTTYLVANFTKRDLILHALGIGCCSEECNGDELRFVYEKHPSFEMFPTFLLTIYFAAEPDSHNSKGKSGIRPFPPDSMTLCTNNESGIIPTMLLKNHGEVKQVEMLPILHISQSLVFHNEILFNNKSNGTDYPVQIHLRTEITSIRPRNVGTFVTTETKYYQRECCIATAQMTALVYGMNPDKVIQWQGHQSCVNDENVPKSATTEKTMHKFTIPSNAALLYRLSGDYNPIHVEGTDGDAPGPLLHGLCTMGYATRAILKHIRFYQSDVHLTAIGCNFVKPVFVGEVICVEVWSVSNDGGVIKNNKSVCKFVVYRASSGETLIDKGHAEFRVKTASKL